MGMGVGTRGRCRSHKLKPEVLPKLCDAIIKLAKAYDSNSMKLQFACPAIIKVQDKSAIVGSVVSRLIVACGLARKFGKAPQGYMERSLSSVVEAMKKGK